MATRTFSTAELTARCGRFIGLQAAVGLRRTVSVEPSPPAVLPAPWRINKLLVLKTSAQTFGFLGFPQSGEKPMGSGAWVHRNPSPLKIIFKPIRSSTTNTKTKAYEKK